MNKELLYKIMWLVCTIVLFYVCKSKYMYFFALSYIIYMIIFSLIKDISFDKYFTKYDDKKKALLMGLLGIIIIGVILIVLFFLIAKIFNILTSSKNIYLIFILPHISITLHTIIILIKDYLKIHNYNKLSNILPKLYIILCNILFILASIIIFKILKISSIRSINYLYIPSYISFIATILICYFYGLKNIKTPKITSNITYKNYCRNLKQTYKQSINKGLINITSYIYIYTSLIMLYPLLISKYQYGVISTSKCLTDIYFYYMAIILIISDIITTTKNKNIKSVLNTLNKSLFLVACLSTFGDNIIYIIYKVHINIGYLVYLTLFMTFLNTYKQIYINIIPYNKKIIHISLISGIILKMVLTVPFMSSYIRMGQDPLYGDLLSSSIALLISSMIGFIYLLIKEKTSISRLIEQIINILNENIMLCLILIIFRIIMPIKMNNRIISLLYLTIYIILVVLLLYIKKYIKRKKEGR